MNEKYDRLKTLIDHMDTDTGESEFLSLTFSKSDRVLIGAALRAFKHVIDAEHNYGPFICGTVGAPDTQGLHDEYMICPQYGLSGFAVYKKEHEYSEPGY